MKLPEELRVELSSIAGTRPFGPADRPMGGYVTLPSTKKRAGS